MAGLWDLDPDLVCYGKIMGGGFNVGAYAGKDRWMSLVAPSGGVYQAGTLSANPVGMIAGLATLKKMQRLNAWSELEKKGQFFVAKLENEFQKKSLSYQILRAGSLFWVTPKTAGPIRTLSDIPDGLGELYKPLFHKMLAQKVYLAPSGYEVNFLSMAHTESELESTALKLAQALQEIQLQK
jgi:glutamate-1-semialdehyde 2,1-aminomutase